MWARSGYGVQGRYIVPGFRKLGHDVAIFAWWGSMGGIMEWSGIHGEYKDNPFTVYPQWADPYGCDVARNHSDHWDADICISLVDVWVCQGYVNSLPNRWIPYFPIDSAPVPEEIWGLAKRSIAPVTYSHWGQEELAKIGMPDVDYVPHGVGDAYRPNREAGKVWRMQNGIPQDAFLVGAVWANKGNPSRKNFDGNLRAFAEFAKKHNDAYIYLHCEPSVRYGGVDVWRLVRELGLNGRVVIPNSYLNVLGYEEDWMAAMYNALDVYLSATKGEGWCTLPGTMVWTDKGQKAIETIDTDDVVVSHTGKLKRVTEPKSRQYKGKMVTIQPRFGLPALTLTPEHKVSAIKRVRGHHGIWGDKRLSSTTPQWISASDLMKGDFIWYPIAEARPIQSVRFSDYLSVWDCGDGKIAAKGRNQFGSVFQHPRSRVRPDEVIVDDDLLTIMGYYIAEGCTQPQAGPRFAFHSDEIQYKENLGLAMQRKFGVTGTLYQKERHRDTLVYEDTMLGNLLTSLCGACSGCKHLPDWALWLPVEQAKVLLKAMFEGDGSIDRKMGYMTYTTISEELAEQVQFLLSRVGVMSYLKRGMRNGRGEYDVRVSRPDVEKVPFFPGAGGVGAKREIRRQIVLSDGFAVPIKEVKTSDYEGMVYNLEVEEDNSYLTVSGAIHNCIPVSEAESCGVPVICTDYSSMPELLPPSGPSYKVRVAEWELCPLHSRFAVPDTNDIANGLEVAYKDWRGGAPFPELVKWGEQWYWDTVIKDWWGPFLKKVEHKLNTMPWAPGEHPVLSSAQ